jgi:small subunit ribosomal protein S6|tara:strand:- start:89 stop:505 length:417 start_codon:yes stop_codon:yes gene_type:complete
MRRNALRSYQSVLILKPDLDETQVDQVLEKIGGFLKENDGSCLKVEKWGKKRLAYRVKKNRFGYYLNIYHTCGNQNVSSLETEYKLFAQIIRYLVLRLDDKELERAVSREHKEEGSDFTGREASPVKKESATKASDND